MEWNSPPDYHFPSHPLCEYVEEEKTYETRQQDATLLPDNTQFSLQGSTPSSSLPTYKNESAIMFNGDGAMLSQPLSLPQLEDTAELRQFLRSQTESCSETTFLGANQQQLQQIQHEQVQPQFTADLYAPLPLSQSDFRPVMEYQFQAGFPAVHNTLSPLPLSFSPPLQQPLVASMEVPKISPERRRLCCEEGCKSQARALGLCKRHGGSKRCSSPGCEKSVQSRGRCIRHGGGSRCQEIGCTRASQSYGKCKLHGGGRPCSVVDCNKKAHLKRLCRQHGGGIKCCIVECGKWAQRDGMCMKHVKVLLLPGEM